MRFFQERLASGKVISLGSGFATNANKLLSEIQSRLKDEEAA
jgi:hypothetical protein